MLAAHAGTSDTSAVHYTSNALRRDAMSDATDLTKSFIVTTGRLKHAKFHNADDLAKKFAEKEAAIEALLAEKDAEIQLLKANAARGEE